MSVNTAEEFFRRCIEREAVTEEERMKILIELAQEGQMKSVRKTNRTPDQFADDLAKHYNVLQVKRKEKTR